MECLEFEDIENYVCGFDDHKTKFHPEIVLKDCPDITNDDRCLVFSTGIRIWIYGKIDPLLGDYHSLAKIDDKTHLKDVEKRYRYIIDLVKKYEFSDSRGIVDNMDPNSEEGIYYQKRLNNRQGIWPYPDEKEQSWGSHISIKRDPIDNHGYPETIITVYFNFED